MCVTEVCFIKQDAAARGTCNAVWLGGIEKEKLGYWSFSVCSTCSDILLHFRPTHSSILLFDSRTDISHQWGGTEWCFIVFTIREKSFFISTSKSNIIANASLNICHVFCFSLSGHHIYCWVQPHRGAAGHRRQGRACSHLPAGNRGTAASWALLLQTSKSEVSQSKLFWKLFCKQRVHYTSMPQLKMLSLVIQEIHMKFIKYRTKTILTGLFLSNVCSSHLCLIFRSGSLKNKNQPQFRSEYNVYSTFQSHEPEFDYLKSLEIEEKINKIRWLPQKNAAQFLLSTNGKLV